MNAAANPENHPQHPWAEPTKAVAGNGSSPNPLPGLRPPSLRRTGRGQDGGLLRLVRTDPPFQNGDEQAFGGTAAQPNPPDRAALPRSAGFNSPPDQAKVVLLAARSAQAAWRTVAIQDRLAIVRRVRHLIAERADWLTESLALSRPRPAAELITSEIIPLAEACRFLERQASRLLKARKLGNAGRPLWLSSVQTTVSREPLGVVLILAPSNYPLFLAAVQTLQALVAGNAVLLKPAPGCIDALLAFRHLAEEAGLPASLLQLLPENPAAARALMKLGVDKVVLTGSAETGATILVELAPTLTPATVELSGSDSVFVRSDADLDLVARALTFGLRLNNGATCIAPRRVFVPHELLAALETKLAAALGELGPLPINEQTWSKAAPLIDAALRSGARYFAGSGRAKAPAEPPASGSRAADFEPGSPQGASAGALAPPFGPILLAQVPPAAALFREDLFAPILSLVPVSDDSEAVRFAAACPYALGASIFSRDESAASALANQVRAGVVTINDLIVPTADPRIPFGGRGRSGFGVTRGAEGLLEMTVPKVVAVRRSRFLPHFDAPKPGDAALFTAFLRLSHSGDWSSRLSALRQVFHSFRRRDHDPGAALVKPSTRKNLP
jgi:acyl-CoA reductase-like NAD-dependent aldehyde dehydrogenase